MANSLLDFVMSLVRDPDAAARYAADPEQAIAAANLTGVTSADVSNLIPVVTESLPVSGPLSGLGFDAADAAGNVWASGAATAAFDAFDDPLPQPGVDEVADWTRPVIDAGEPALDEGLTDLAARVTRLDDAPLQLDSVIDDDVSIVEAAPPGDWTGAAPEPEPLDDAGPAFDFFD